MAYKKDLDYSALIKQAAGAGDLAQAAALEAARNQKIAGEGMDYAQTSDFSNYLGTETFKPAGETTEGNTDWSNVLKGLMSRGASSADVGSALQSRVSKAMATPGLSQYAYDDVYNQARGYIEQNQQKDKFDSLLDRIVNRDPFSYDPAKDPSYQAYATQYTNQGNKAMQDTMGSFAGMTGGLPSSAAMAAAQQANNEYMSELSAMVPQLEQMQYGRYQDEISNDVTALGALQGVMQDERDYQTDQEDKAFAKAQDLLSMGFSNAEIAKIMGISEQQAQNYASMVNQGMQLDVANSQATLNKKLISGTGGGSKPSYSPDADALFDAARKSDNPQNFISSNYKKYGFTSSSGLYTQYKDEYEYNPGNVSGIAKALYTDLNKYYSSNEDWLNRIEKEYGSRGISKDDYMWLLDKFGML